MNLNRREFMAAVAAAIASPALPVPALPAPGPALPAPALQPLWIGYTATTMPFSITKLIAERRERECIDLILGDTHAWCVSKVEA